LQVCCPNGMDWDQDKNVFYFIDTADAVVRSYPVDENGVPKRSQDGVLLGVKDVSHAFSLFNVMLLMILFASVLPLRITKLGPKPVHTAKLPANLLMTLQPAPRCDPISCYACKPGLQQCVTLLICTGHHS